MNDAPSEYGEISLDPTGPVVVGTYRSWEITYTVGDLGMDDGSTLKIASNMTSDWGHPQFEHPGEDNYAAVETSGPASVEASYDPEGYVRPWKPTITIDIFDGSLDKGDTITLTLGDRSEGSMGHRAQTFPENDFRLIGLVDPFGTGDVIELPDDLTFDVVPGDPHSLTAIGPSTADPNEPITVSVRVEDYWGNTATSYDGTVTITGEPLDQAPTITVQNGTASDEVSLSEPGTHRLNARTTDDTTLETTTNPIQVDASEQSIFWGDIHGQSGETVGTGDIWEYLSYTRDNAFLDFTSHTGNDFQITDEFWEEIQDAIEDYHDPGEFVTFLAYEWSANTSRGGDHNVYFKGDEAEIHRSSNWQTEDGYQKHDGLRPVEDLYDHYAGRDDVLIIPHQGGRPATLDGLDPELSPFVEIVSVWGVFEWFGKNALDEGHHVGFVGGSDDHTNRIGATHPTNHADFNIRGGLMAVQADELTRDELWESFEQRQCYATTGARIVLNTTIERTSMGGSTTVRGTPDMNVTVDGTAPLRRAVLYRGSDPVASREFDTGTEAVEFRWSGTRSKTRHKAQDWTGGLSIDQGTISNVDEFGFHHPEQGVTKRTDTSVEWDAVTSGNYQGIRVEFDAPPDTAVSFSSRPLSTEFTLSEIDEGRTIDAGSLESELEVRRVKESEQRHADISLVDAGVEKGTYPYFVRVSQTDGEMAWSSPILVNVE